MKRHRLTTSQKKSEYSQYLYDLRIKAGLSQGNLAKSLGYTTAQFVSNWERGLSMPPAESIQKIAILLKCSEDEFLEKYITCCLNAFEMNLRSRMGKSIRPAAKKAA